MKLPDLSVKKPVTVSMLIMIIVVLGIISMSRMGLDLMPDITFPIVTVITPYEGVNSEDIENLVTKPVEEAVAMTKNIKNINSVSREGFSAVMAEYEWGTDINYAAQEIRDKMEVMSYVLPDDMGETQVVKFDPSLIPVSGWSVTGEMPPDRLRKIAEDEVEDRLQQVDGVSAIYVWGGAEREIRVELEAAKLQSLGIPAEMVASAIGSSNVNMPGGRITRGHTEITLRAKGEFETVDDIRNTYVATRGNVPVFVGDLGKVLDTFKETRALARTNGKPSVMLMLYKESGANTVVVSDRVNKKMKEIEASLPKGVRLYKYLDQGHIIKRILNVTFSSALWGGFLAVGILFFFLRSWRPTLIIAAAIPLSMLAAFLPLFSAGFTINFVILIGVALGVGMIVDNAIVVIENSYRQLAITGDSYLASSMGAKQVAMAITASTFTTVVVFVPLLFAGGIVGKIFSQLAITVASALISSLIVALTIIPMLSSRLLASREKEKKIKWMENLRERYASRLAYFLDHKKKAGLLAAGAIIVSIAAFPFMSKEYFPAIDNSMLMIDVKRKAGTVVEETDRIIRVAEEAIEKEESIDVYSAFMGVMEGGEMDAAMGTGPSGPHEGSIFIKLKDKKDRKVSDKTIKNSIRRSMPPMEDVRYRFMDMGHAMLVSGGSQEYPIQIKLYGDDLAALESLAEKIKAKIEQVPGVYDVSTSLEERRPEYEIKIRRPLASQYGLTPARIASAMKTSVKGVKAGVYREKGKEVDINVILRESDRKKLELVKNIPVMTERGIINLSQVVKVEGSQGPVKLEREDRKRIVTVAANYSGTSFSGVMNRVREKVSEVFIPSGYTLKYGGEAEDVREMFATLFQLFILAILLIYMVMAAQFESFIQPLMIMMTLPLAFVGVVWFLILTGKSISMPSAMGVLILFGIVVNNAIVLIDFINQLRRDHDMKIRDAVLEGARTRLRPIMMTAATTIIAMVPMALSRAEGSAMRSVVALSIIGGLLVATVLTLFVIPLIYEYIEGKLEASRLKKKVQINI